MRVGFLVTSPVIGALTDATSLRWGLCVLVVVGVTVSLLAPSLAAAPAPVGSSRRVETRRDRGRPAAR